MGLVGRMSRERGCQARVEKLSRLKESEDRARVDLVLWWTNISVAVLRKVI